MSCIETRICICCLSNTCLFFCWQCPSSFAFDPICSHLTFSFHFNFSSFFFLVRSWKKVDQCAEMIYFFFCCIIFINGVLNMKKSVSFTNLETWIAPTSPNDIIRDEVFIASPKKKIADSKNSTYFQKQLVFILN